MTTATTELDNPWNDVVELHFEQFMLFFFPDIHKRIDFSRNYEFVDEEVKGAEKKLPLANKLVKVWLNNGKNVRLYFHLELQEQKDEEFAKRLFICNYNLYDKYGSNVVSLALLGDDQADWRLKSYSYGLGGFTMFCRFPVVKLLDYEWDFLESSDNPFSIVVQAHLKALETSRSQQKRLRWKKELFKALCEAGYSSKKDFLEFFRFLDWAMALPDGLGQQFYNFIIQYEEDNNLSYITDIERLGLEKGRKEGRKEGIELGTVRQSRQSVLDILRFRFKRVPQPLSKKIQAIEDAKMLTKLLQEAVSVSSLDMFKKRLEKLA